MGDDSLILREDGYIRMNFPVTSLTYHSNLNIILVKTDIGGLHVLDVNSGVILQSFCLDEDEGDTLGVEYAAGSDRVFVWNDAGIGARTDYNGVLLLHTVLQRPLPSSQPDKPLRIELVLSEAVLLYQCLQSLDQSLDTHSIEGLIEFIAELKNAIDTVPVRKGVKAQKWSTVIIRLPQSILRSVTTGVVQELKGQSRRIPALAIASAVGHRANELVPCLRDEESRALMYSEAERKETFKRWPHMDYKWALPARMAQAGFYHQPSPSGDDRAMCFTCMVCLVCWEKSDEPWVEHERHSPNCLFVRGEYTHNVPISVTNATASAVPCLGVTIVSKGNTGEFIATGTADGKVNIWRFDCGLKLAKFIHLSPYDSIFSGILATDSNKVWSASLEKDSSTYSIELTAMSFVGLHSQQEQYPQTQTSENIEKDTISSKSKSALICAVTVTRTSTPTQPTPISEDSNKALFDFGEDKSDTIVQTMNDQNEAKNNLASSNKMLFLLTYDIHSSLAGSITTVVHTSNSSGNSKPGGSKKCCTVARTDDANIYDESYFQYSDDDTELPQCTNNIIDEQMSNVINLNASSSKEDSKSGWDSKNLFTKQFKVLPLPPTALLPELPESGQGSMLDNIGKISQLKSWKSGHLDSGTKLADQTDSAMSHANPITHYLNMNGPLEISNLKWIEGGDGTEKIKGTSFNGKSGTQTTITNSNNDGFDSDPPQEEVISQGIAIQCLSIPANLDLGNDSKVTHILPTEDKEHLLVVISTIDPEKIKNMDTEKEVDTKMDIDEIINTEKRVQMDNKAYLLLFKISSKTSVCTIEDIPVSVKELLYHESPVDLCLLPADKQEQFSVAVVGVDGSLRLYSLPDFKVTSEKQVPKGQFTSVVYCASVERLSVSTKHGMIYFYALNNGEKDSTGDLDEDDFANLDFDMLQKAPRDEVCGPTPAPIIIANKTELDMSDLETLMSLTGSYGTNTTVPYSAVVPGFWCELSPAQRSRSDNQNNKTWRLQNTSSTWDEHVLEITLPYSVPLAHIEFGFTLQIPTSTNLPVIQVTLLKQNLHGIGYKKDATFGQRSDSPVYYPVDSEMSSNMDNPVNTEEYLQAHNAEILAGPLLLSSGLDLTQQSGTLILTSPRLYRARGRTFLIHIKTSFDPAKDMNKGPSKSGESSSSNSSKKSGFIGCDWLHQISLTVRSSQYTDVPMERQQRIAMLESNTFLNTLCEVSVSKSNLEKRKLALDLLMWVLSVRLQRLRAEQAGMKESLGAIESQQIECVNIIEKYTDALIRHCILCANRSVAKKCVKILLITGEGVKQLPRPWKSTFEHTIKAAVAECISLVGACESPGALRWLIALAQHTGGARELVARGLDLLETCAKCLTPRSSPYQRVLANRFGLYGLPFESNIFATDPPELGRGSSVPLTYASVLAGDTAVPPAPKQDHQLKELLNLNDAETDSKTPISPNAWWAQNNGVGVFGAGLSEAMALHVSCHVASDGTKLELSGAGQRPPVVNALPTHAQQLWTVVKEGQMKQTSQDPDSLQDVESSLMDCDPQEKLEFSEEKFFKEQEQCSISWATLVSRPPQHTLVVDRMHSGARRYIVLDLGHTVRLTDVIIPSCSDLVTLCIDIWVTSEETDSVKLAYATDIATKHLVLTDMQPKPLCRYMKITTIGRYGMSAMKCKISLGWFYGEIADLKSVSASQRALIALREDLSCRFKLSTGKLIELLNPYLDLYNANAAHMMAYLNLNNESDPKVLATYQECIELQQEMHTCNNILRRLENRPDSNEKALDMIMKGELSPEHLLERASTDKLRVISENIVDMLLYFLFQVPDVQHEEVSLEWCETVTPLLWQWSVVGATALATLLARLCGGAVWWGPHVADTLHAAADALHPPPYPLDRVLVLVMYMSRKSVFSHTSPDTGVTHALTTRVVQLLQKRKEKPALLAAMLTALSCVLDAVVASMPNKNSASSNRWEWVRGGRSAVPTPDSESRAARRKLHKKLFQHMHELDAARRQLDDLQRTRTENKNRAVGGLVSGALAAGAAQALCAHVLCARCERHALLLCAKVIGRLCAVTGSALLDPPSILGIAKLCVGVEPWPRHALTSLLQDIVENETSESQPESPTTSSGSDSLTAPRSSRRKTATLWPPPSGKAPRMWNYKAPCVADMLADSFGLPKNTDMSKVSKLLSPSSPKIISSSELEKPLGLESDDSDNEDKAEQHGWIMAAVKTKETKSKAPSAEENTTVSSSNISWCIDARLASGPAAAGEVLARRVLAAGATALPAAVTAPPPPPRLPPPPPPPPPTVPVHVTLQDVFTHLALELPNQTDCNYLENMVSLWLTLSGSVSGTGSTPGVDTPRIRVAPDTVTAILHSLCTLENINLRCWVLSMQAIAQMAILSIQGESGTHTIGRLILESEYFVPTIVKFVTMNINGDTGVTPYEPYLGGATGPGSRACSVLQLVLGRVFGARVAAVAAAALRCVEAACARAAPVSELHAALLRCAAPLAPALRLTPALLAAVRRTFSHAASQCSHWVRESSGRSAGEAARARRSAPAQLLHYCRRLLQVSLPPSIEDSQTDESKAQHSAADATNIEDEKKQMAGKSPCVADHIIQQADIMEKLYKALSLCDGLNASTVNSSGLISDASDNFVLKDEVFCLLAYMAEVATDPSQMLPTLMDLLRRDCIQMSQALQQLTVQLLDKPEVLAAWISMGGVQLCVDKLLQCQQSGPSPNQGLVASLMNYLKTPQIINLSTSGNKKNQPAVVEPTDGLINIAPLCTVSCNNPSAQSADVLLGGGGGACAARRVRAAAWTYHFFGCDDDAALALTLKLPYAARLHELQLQPHLTSLATCPGAVEIEAGCGGTVAPLGPPQNTAGATQIRLVAARAPVVTTVLVRLYRPRDSANMGLLQLRLLVHATGATDRRQAHWTPVMAASSRSPVGAMRLANALYADCSRTLSACVSAGGAHAARALLSAAAAHAPLRKPLVRTLLTAPPDCRLNERGRVRRRYRAKRRSTLDGSDSDSGAGSDFRDTIESIEFVLLRDKSLERPLASRRPSFPASLPAPLSLSLLLPSSLQPYTGVLESFQMPTNKHAVGSTDPVCSLLKQLCTRCPTDSVDAFIEWLATARAEPSTQHLNTLAEVLWSLKEEHLLDHLLLESLITEELFEFVYKWTGEVTDNSLVKKALDSILCSMCFIRPHLYRRLLHHMNIPVDTDATMECLTDDTKVHGLSAGAASSGPGWVWQVAPAQLVTAAAAAASPHAARMLLASSLPTAAAAALAEFGQAKYDEIKAYNMSCEDELMTDTIRDPKIDTESEIASLEQAVALVKFIGMVCRCRAGQLWGGTACWRSLLLALCAVRPPHRSWQEERIWSDLEESTIRMLMEATTCNPPQQRILATTLHSVLLETPAPEAAGLTGFSRSLLLRLVVASERVMVEVTWSHLSGGTRRMMAPLHAACGQVLRECTPPVPLMEDTPKPFSMPSSSGGSVLRSASDTAIMTVAEAWELSLAAASASKDKRVKDVKNTSLKHHNTKKRHSKQTNDASLLTVTDELLETSVRVQVPGLEGFIPPSTTLAQLCAAVPHTFGPRLTLILHLNTNGEAHGGPSWEGGGSSNATAGGASNTLREFGACGGLALVAARLPRPHAPPPAAPVTAPPPDADWVKLDDAYEEVVEGGATSGGSSGEEGGCVGVPGHALVALRLLLKLAGYAAALLDAGPRAVQLLRLLLGAARDDDGRNISVCGSGGSLGTLPFRVVARLLEAPEVDGAALRRQLLQRGAVPLLLHSLALLTRHQHHQNSSNAGGVAVEEKGQLYWAKGTGFGTGSTQQSWNVEQALVRQRTEEEHVTVLLQVLASYINPGEKWPPEEGAVMPPEPEGEKEGGDEEPHDMPSEFIELIANSCLVPAICSYLRNDSVLDMSRHIPLYVQAVRCARALHALRSARLRTLLRPLPALLRCMARTTAAYAAKLRMSKKTIFGKMTYSQRFSSSSNSELSEEDEGLASLIADIQATSALLWRVDGEPESLGSGRALGGASREQRYMQLMRQVQFETFEMIAECPEGGWRFTVPYHFESCVRAAGERAAPARMKRLAQEAATLATSLPLSYSSSVFVRTDADRLDVMKVLIIGPSDTPYANGCFILDVYFPAEYPAVPMLINLETTGRRSVRFNPNLYNDGKVCLSVLNTWHGRPEEKWNAHTSSFLQVLVSIQSLILVPEPYFNEPGYEQSRGTRVGSCASLEYNSNIYQATVRWAMLDHLRAPPPPFQQVIQTHFWMKRNEIMQTVANWITELENQTGDERTQRSIQLNLTALKRHYVKLQEELGKLPVPPGCEDLDEPFQLPAAPAAAPPAAAPPPPPPPPPPDHDHDMEKIVSHVLD